MKTLLLVMVLAAGYQEPATKTVADQVDQALTTSLRASIGGDEAVMVGEIAVLTAEDSNNAKSYQWIIRPKPLSMKKANKQGSVLYVSHNKAEVFEIELTVASATGELDSQIGMLEVKGAQEAATAETDVMPTRQSLSGGITVSELTLALRQFKELQELLHPVVQQHSMIPMPTATGMMGVPTQNPSNALPWNEGIKRMAQQVRSNSRSGEGKAIAGSFRMVANRVKTGTVTDDPWTEAFAQSKEALGQSWTVWSTFFNGLGSYVDGMNKQGMLNPQLSVMLLESAAQELSGL